ncbi:MAG: hypothetical protein U9P44_00050 [archaeon]|nr:hypothetical protein [archaeon]
MSLKDLLSRNSKTIEKFAKEAKESGKPVDILMHIFSEQKLNILKPKQSGLDINDAYILYSLGTYEEVLTRTNKTFIQTHDTNKNKKMFYSNEQEIFDEIRDEAEENLSYLSSQDINYTLRILVSH